MNYKQAMKPKDGWKHAQGESLIASAATFLGNKHCLNPEAVFDWAKEYCPDLYGCLINEGEKLFPPDTRVLTCVLNDLPLPEKPEFAYGEY